MLTLKQYLLIVGAGLIGLGRVCLPVANLRADPLRVNAFSRLADTGAFFSVAGWLTAVGLAIVLLTLLVSLLVHMVRRLTRRSR